MGSDDTALPEGAVEKFEVGLLEESLSGTLGVGGVSDDNVELVLVVGKELEAITNVDSDLGVVESGGHVGEVLLGEADDGLGNREQ